MTAAAAEGIFEFGPFRLDTGQRLLLRDGVPVALLPKSFDALVALVRSGGLLEKDALLAAVCPTPWSKRTASPKRSPISGGRLAKGRRISATSSRFRAEAIGSGRP